MLSSTRTHHRQQPSISKPMPATQFATVHVSPPTSPSGKAKSRRPSVSSPMTWLSRASSSASTQSGPYAPSRPVRISEPRFAHPGEAMTLPRSGVLGAGATVVRTPQEALAGPKASASSPDLLSRVRSPTPVRESDELDECPASPPLPPIPDHDSEYVDEAHEEAEDSETVDWHSATTSVTLQPHPPPPTRPPPSLPSIPDLHSDMSHTRPVSPLRLHKSPSPLDFFPAVPPLPASALATPPQPSFSAILVSPTPNAIMDPSKIIVSLETSTAVHRTTMSTLTSRQSHLASYLLGLLPLPESDTRSIYSITSEAESSFNSIFHHHLASSGVLGQASTNLHIFLDRPSAPYAHILTYLRTPVSTSESLVTLPHSVRLNGSSSRLEALLELRDEAFYLGLEELHTMCVDELRHRHQPSPSGLGLGLHMRGFSNASAKSLRTLREAVEPEPEDGKGQRNSGDSGFSGSGTGSTEADAPWPSPPSLKQRTLNASSPKKDPPTSASLKERPTGTWI